MTSVNSFKAKSTLVVGGKTYTYYSILEAEKNGLKGVSALPHSMKVVLENLLRHEDGRSVTKADIAAQGYDFSLNRYKEVVHEAVEHRAPKEILADLTKLEEEIQRGIKELGGML